MLAWVYAERLARSRRFYQLLGAACGVATVVVFVARRHRWTRDGLTGLAVARGLGYGTSLEGWLGEAVRWWLPRLPPWVLAGATLAVVACAAAGWWLVGRSWPKEEEEDDKPPYRISFWMTWALWGAAGWAVAGQPILGWLLGAGLFQAAPWMWSTYSAWHEHHTEPAPPRTYLGQPPRISKTEADLRSMVATPKALEALVRDVSAHSDLVERCSQEGRDGLLQKVVEFRQKQ